MKKRALVLKGGTMRGAFIVGALKTFYRKLGPDYFDAIFANSVGVFEQVFFASGQIYFMENTWRNYVSGNQLINFLNPIKGKPVLDLDYLVNLFQSEKSLLDVEAMRASHPKLTVFIAEYDSREIVGVDVKKNDVFEIMKATCALPIIYPKKVMIDGKRYVDSLLAPKERLKEALAAHLKEYDEVIAIIPSLHDDRVLEERVNVLRPSAMPLWNILDTNHQRINETIDQGEKDAEEFLETISISKEEKMLQFA